MNKQLIEDISYTLNIQQYSTEKAELYQARIIYSAISVWMKYILLDHMIHEDEAEVKSKNYHYRRSTEILEEYINLFPRLSHWLYSDKNIDPIHIIRNGLIAAGEINEVDLSGNITLAKKKIIPINKNISRVIEISTSMTAFKYVGLTKIIKTKNEFEIPLQIENSLGLVNEFINQSFYQEMFHTDSRYELYNVFRSDKYKISWTINGILDSEINLIRKERNQVNYYDYYLVLKRSGTFYQYPLNEVLVNQGFHNRLILGLRQLYDNPIVAKYKKHQQIIELNLDRKLPRYEESFLRTYAWPKNHISDNLSFIIPLELWNTVSQMLEPLGYKMEEC